MWKPAANLTLEDLKQTPVWECKENGGADIVSPTALRALTEYRSGPGHIALTQFVLGNGALHYGYCSPADSSGLDYTQPVIITPSGQIQLWNTSKSNTQLLARWLHVEESSLLPITIECLVPVDGAFYTEVVSAL